jgi:hypothetical protein
VKIQKIINLLFQNFGWNSIQIIKSMKKLSKIFIIIFLLISSFNFTFGTDPPSEDPITAPGECQKGGMPNLCCPYWVVTITWEWTGPTTSCSTGGEFKCKENC